MHHSINSLIHFKVYSILGEEVAILIDEIQGARNYIFHLSGTSSTGGNLASDVCFYGLVANPVGGGAQPFVLLKKMMFLK